MKVLLTGSSGLVGTALSRRLRQSSHEVVRLVRDRAQTGPDALYWCPSDGVLEGEALEGLDAVINLAGAPIADGRWSTARKREIRESRTLSTMLLAKAVSMLNNPPPVMLSASAVGFYGDTGQEQVDEDSPAGRGFLSEVCRAWEAAAETHCPPNTRLALLRFGMVLSTEGGALAKMLLPFRLGLGGPLGNGRQWISWISIEDAVEAILFCLKEESVRGPVNVVSPSPVTNREFTRTLGKALRRPTVLPLPQSALRALFGEMGETLLLSSSRVMPSRLQQYGFKFAHVELSSAFNALLAR